MFRIVKAAALMAVLGLASAQAMAADLFSRTNV
jgi:hypothetical protein